MLTWAQMRCGALYCTQLDELEVRFSDLDQRAASLRSVLDGIALEKKKPAEHAQTGCFDNWLPIVDAYRTICVAQETVSRWRKKPEYIAAIEAILSSARSETVGRLTELTDKALDVIDEMLDYRYDKSLKLRAAVALLQISGIGRAMSTAASAKAPSTSDHAAVE